MRNVLLLLFICVSVIQEVFPKDYQTIIPDRESYFVHTPSWYDRNAKDTINAIRIDSVYQGQGYVEYFNYPVIRENSLGSRYDINGAPWVGKKVVSLSDRDLYFNKNGDTIVILTDTSLKVNDSWVFMKLDSGVSIIAKIYYLEWDNVLGNDDSLRYIRLQAKKNGNDIQHPLNDWNLKLTKKNGIINMPVFYELPDIFLNYELRGYKGNELGIKLISIKDAYNFDPGDIIQYLECQTYIMSSWYTDELTTIKILDHQLLDTGHLYNMEIEFEREKIDYMGYSYYHDLRIIDTIISYNCAQYALPGEQFTFISNDHGDSREFRSSVTYYFNRDIGYRQTISEIGFPICYDERDSSWSWGALIEGGRLNKHTDGLGFTYSPYNAGEDWRGLTYYKKGSFVWGVREKLTDINDHELKQMDDQLIYDPINQRLIINPDGTILHDSRFRLFNLIGNELMDIEGILPGNSISVGELSPGVYFCHITCNGFSKVYKISVSN